MITFLDTEFTDLLNSEFLSLGLVSFDGRKHYVELDLTTDTGKARIKASGKLPFIRVWEGRGR